MISILQYKNIHKGIIALLAPTLFFAATPSSRADSLSVTVTPPLFQLTIGPGEQWTSSLKVVNTNSYDVTYYAQVVDMQPSGEDGRSKFTPVINEPQEEVGQFFTLARWIHTSSEPIFVKAGSSMDVPFTIQIPPEAEPGGHYAAILVGTQPGGLHATGTVLKVSSFVSSLFFVRIKGAVNESGRIREFLTSQQLYQTPKADFLLRFENTGATHVRPRGSIAIYNMWGKERGVVPINQDADNNFGNVLPHSVRRFEFSWESDANLFDIGLYSAIVTLAFGEDAKQNVTGKTYFWVVPVVPVLCVLFALAAFILTLFWFIRRYIRRALALEQKRYGVSPEKLKPNVSLVETLIEPVREGVIDLRSAAKGAKPAQVWEVKATNHHEEAPNSFKEFGRKYRLVAVFLFLIVISSVIVGLYVKKVLLPKQSFQITDVHIKAESVQKP